MTHAKRLAFVTALALVCAGAVLVNGKAQQRDAITELLKQDYIAVQFADGEYCESLEEAQERNWLVDTVDVVYFDVPQGSSLAFLSQLERLHSLARVVIRYQGNDFEEFRSRRAEIQQRIAEECAIVAQALPDLEVLNCWAVVQSENAE